MSKYCWQEWEEGAGAGSQSSASRCCTGSAGQGPRTAEAWCWEAEKAARTAGPAETAPEEAEAEN